VGIGATATQAYWVDPASVTGSVLSTGRLDLQVQGADSVTNYTAMNVSSLEPGDSTAGVLTVTNSGTAPLSYYVDANASNTDGMGLASTLVAKVTSDPATSGSSPSVTCGGAALTGSGVTFGAGLVGSSSTPRVLAAGASEKLCVQARLPNGAVAQGGATNIALTFNAFTGTSAAPGWADTVPVSGIALGSVHAFYLGTTATGNSTYAAADRVVRRTGPTMTTLFNYDTDRDSQPGLVLNKGNGVPTIERFTLTPALSAPLTIAGTATLRLWSAVKGFDTTKVGALQVGLYDCDASAANCITLSSTSYEPTGPWNSSGAWSSRTFTLASGSYTFAAGRVLQVRLSATNASGDDMMIAYDTTTYRSAVIIQ
jgi:hypothetical protein